jgi:hypothetical protein
MAKKYEELKGRVTMLHNKNGCRVFDVSSDLGEFRVMDYSYDPLDREIFWSREVKRIHTGCEEYDVASALANAYIYTVYDKLNATDKKNWPLV